MIWFPEQLHRCCTSPEHDLQARRQLVLSPNNCLWTYLGERLRVGRCFFVQVVTAEGMELWMVLISAILKHCLFPVNRVSFHCCCPAIDFSFQPKLCTALCILVKYFFCHPVKCYHLPLVLEQVKSVFMIRIRVLLRYYRDSISLVRSDQSEIG